MKVIDLLNKIANGEEVKAKLKFKLGDIIITYYGQDNYYHTPEYNIEYIDKGCTTHDFNLGMIIKHLNDTVEIIEEEKKIPEKLKIEQDTPSINYYIRNENGAKCYLTTHSKIITETLNQVIDYLKSKGDV